VVSSNANVEDDAETVSQPAVHPVVDK